MRSPTKLCRMSKAVEDTAPVKTTGRKEQVRNLLSQIEKTLGAKAENATVADFIRLTQLERDMEQDEQPGKVVVRWDESPEILDA